jgi:osmotically-inducible protein OsmY
LRRLAGRTSAALFPLTRKSDNAANLLPWGNDMARPYAVAALLCAITLPLALGGCVGAVVVGGLAAAAGTGYAAGQERGVVGAVDDFKIKNDVDKALLAADPKLQDRVNTTVYNGRVLLDGRVATQTERETAQQVASATPNVKGVYNELEVAPAEGMWNDAKDAWITARVRSEMVLDPDIRSVNFDIDTANGSVYLMGSAHSQDELDRATRIARYVPGVKRVVSYVEVFSGAPVASAPVAPHSIGRPGAAPGGAIEVQKL